jgi:hypothetical protein
MNVTISRTNVPIHRTTLTQVRLAVKRRGLLAADHAGVRTSLALINIAAIWAEHVQACEQHESHGRGSNRETARG